MVFQADAAFALILIALGFGFLVLVKASNQEAGNARTIGTILGYFIMVFSFLILLCAGYYSLRYWANGDFAAVASKAVVVESMGTHGDGCGMMKGSMNHNCDGMIGDHMSCPNCGDEMKGKKMPCKMHDEMEGKMDHDLEMEHSEDEE